MPRYSRLASAGFGHGGLMEVRELVKYIFSAQLTTFCMLYVIQYKHSYVISHNFTSVWVSTSIQEYLYVGRPSFCLFLFVLDFNCLFFILIEKDVKIPKKLFWPLNNMQSTCLLVHIFIIAKFSWFTHFCPYIIYILKINKFWDCIG